MAETAKLGTKHGPTRDAKTGRVSGGNPGNKGGGRKPWVFHEEMRRALQESDAGTVVRKIISGDIHDVLGVTKDGEPIVGETKNADRLKALQIAASYAHGLPVQATIDLTPQEPAVMAASALLEAIPRLLAILPGGSADKVKLLQGIEVDGEVVE